ncbi:MAG: phosphoribosyl-AMP cyclohydrolase [Leptonema sp. (in: Bacteria)]|nr:phosphoribosyl-AMP cyclohydrolase [Leptonema sp. (in: bacteria)]
MNHTNQNQNKIDEHQIEEGSQLLLDFAKLAKISESVLPVIVQHFTTKEVLILAYVNQEAFSKSIELGQAVFYSTSRKKLWHKGSTSGDFLTLKEIRVNCEQNSLLFLVDPVTKGVCHTKDKLGQTRPTCYYRQLKNGELKFIELTNLQ